MGFCFGSIFILTLPVTFGWLVYQYLQSVIKKYEKKYEYKFRPTERNDEAIELAYRVQQAYDQRMFIIEEIENMQNKGH